MPKKRANIDDQAPVSDDRPLHAPAFDPPVEPDQPPNADDTDTEEK